MTRDETADERTSLEDFVTKRVVAEIIRRQPAPLFEGLIPRVRPRNSSGVATMARLMQRTRDERDFGGAVDDDA